MRKENEPVYAPEMQELQERVHKLEEAVKHLQSALVVQTNLMIDRMNEHS